MVTHHNRSVNNSRDSDDVVVTFDDHHRGEGFRPGSVHELPDEDVLHDRLVRQVLTDLFAVQKGSFLKRKQIVYYSSAILNFQDIKFINISYNL